MKAYWFNQRKNLGDLLSPVTIKGVTGVTPEWSDITGSPIPRVIGLGSIMGAVRPGDMVWGTGLISENANFDIEGAHVLAVRGPLTAAKLGVDVPFGDPALLMPRFYKPTQVTKKWPVGIVPHYVDYGSFEAPKGATVIDVRMNWQKTIDYITSCEVIVSSSLHGLIIAEVYGIPAVWVKISSRVLGGSFKFDDYYLSTGRKPVKPGRLSHFKDALASVQPPIDIDLGPLMEVSKRLPRV